MKHSKIEARRPFLAIELILKKIETVCVAAICRSSTFLVFYYRYNVDNGDSVVRESSKTSPINVVVNLSSISSWNTFSSCWQSCVFFSRYITSAIISRTAVVCVGGRRLSSR